MRELSLFFILRSCESLSSEHLTDLTGTSTFTAYERCWYLRLLTCDPVRYQHPNTALSLASSVTERTKVADNTVNIDIL